MDALWQRSAARRWKKEKSAGGVDGEDESMGVKTARQQRSAAVRPEAEGRDGYEVDEGRMWSEWNEYWRKGGGGRKGRRQAADRLGQNAGESAHARVT